MVDNHVRSFSMYAVLERPLQEFIEQGDGIFALPVYEEIRHPDAPLVDASMINLIKLISTAFGRSCLPQAYTIVERIHQDEPRKQTLRFRSRHPLYTHGSPKYQNICLVSGMVYMGIPILPYFDGDRILNEDEDYESILALLRDDNHTLL